MFNNSISSPTLFHEAGHIGNLRKNEDMQFWNRQGTMMKTFQLISDLDNFKNGNATGRLMSLFNLVKGFL